MLYINSFHSSMTFSFAFFLQIVLKMKLPSFIEKILNQFKFRFSAKFKLF